RVYTDNGKGNGRLTPEGMRYARSLMRYAEDDSASGGAFLAPLVSLTMASRAEMHREWERVIATGEADAKRPPAEREWHKVEMDLYDHKARGKLGLITTLVPAYGSTLQKFDEA